MTRVLCIQPDGQSECLNMKQEEIYQHIPGPISFVGAIQELEVFLVGTTVQNDGLVRNTSISKIDVECYGPVYAIGSDLNGNEQDIDTNAVIEHIDIKK